MRRLGIGLLACCVLTSCSLFSPEEGTEAKPAEGVAAGTTAADGWVDLFDGKTLNGWKINENPSSWSVKDGAIVANGERSHLFYVGDEKPFVNFELEVVAMTLPNSNSGVYFHTKYQDSGWPKYGFEMQVNNSHGDPQRTGGLYAVVPVPNPPSKDNEWFTLHLKVEGKKITVKDNGQTVVDYTEPEGQKPGEDFTRVVDQGTFALQAHDPGSTVKFKSLRVRRLP